MPSNQILKNTFSNEQLSEFLQKCCNQLNGYYVFNVDSYKKAKFHGYIQELCNILLEYYYPSKHHYLKRELKFSRFVTILRHVCNHNHIPFTTRIYYANNTYYITYYIKCIENDSTNTPSITNPPQTTP